MLIKYSLKETNFHQLQIQAYLKVLMVTTCINIRKFYVMDLCQTSSQKHTKFKKLTPYTSDLFINIINP